MEVPFAAAAAAGQSEEEQLKVVGRTCVVCMLEGAHAWCVCGCEYLFACVSV
jgi:hypothetical protein